MTIPEISVLLEEKKFIQAEAALSELQRADGLNASIAYLLGTLYNNYSNPSRSREKAQKYFSVAATGNSAVEEAFIALARLESHSNHAIRIIEKGLSLFPKSEGLFLNLFRNSTLENREAVFLRAQAQGVASDEMRAEMVSGFVALREFEQALKLNEQIQKRSIEETKTLMTAICLFELKQIEKATEIFRSIVTNDIDHKFTYVPHFGLIACLVGAQHRGVTELLSEIHTEVDWGASDFAYWPFYFDYSRFVFGIIGTLEKLPSCKGFLPKLRGLRGLLVNANPELFAVARNRVRMIKDLEYARAHLPQTALICKALHDDKVQNGNHFEAYKLALSYFGSAVDPNADDYGLDLDYLATLTAEKFLEIVEDFKQQLPSHRYGLHRDGGIFDVIVRRLHKDGKYCTVEELAGIAGDHYSEKTGVLFEIAYAFAESEKRGKARKFYNLYLQKHGNATAALNNVAILEEHDGRLDQAESLLRKCIELDAEDELPRNNLKRVLRLKDVVEKFQKDDLVARKLVVEIWRRKGPGYEFECDSADMQSVLPLASIEDAKARLRQLIEKGYLEQKDGRRFALSAGLRSQMSDLERIVEKEGEIAKLAGGISKDNLERIGFDDDLLNSLTKIGSAQLQTLLRRDLKEAALARLTDSHKTALVMCGSIIEAVLTDKICGKSIRKYQLENGKSANVSRMDLGDLLYVAKKESLVDDQLYHLAHALRGFRNLIHPGVEQRKKAIVASESNARIAWDITRKLLLEM